MTTAAQYYEGAKLEEEVEKLESEGYTVSRDAKIDGIVFDLVAEKGKERLFFEFIFRKSPKSKSKQLALMQKVANKNGATEFRAIIFDTPKPIEVEITWLEEVMNALIQTQEAEDQVVDVGNGCSFEGVYAGSVTSVKMDDDGIRICGMGEVDVDVHMGPSGEDGTSMSDNFPFIYDITVSYEKQLQEVHSIIIDDSGFYGQDEEEKEEEEEEEEEDEEEGDSEESSSPKGGF